MSETNSGLEVQSEPAAVWNTNWKGIVGMVLGYLGSAPVLFNRWFILAPLVSTVAGVLMLRDIGKGATSSKKLAYAAIALGVLFTALSAALAFGLPVLGDYLEEHDFG